MQMRVLHLRLQCLNRGKEAAVLALQGHFTEAVRFHLARAITLNTTSAAKLHRDCYQEGRRRFALPSSTLQQARDKALSVYRAYLTTKRKGKQTSLPQFRRLLPICLAAENLRVFAEKKVARVTTPAGFLWLPLIVPDCHESALLLPHGVSEILQVRGNWYLNLTVKSEDVPARQGECFGVDLGLANVAVLAGPGLVRFFSGKPLSSVRNRFFQLRQALQRKRKIGRLKRTRGRESRWVTDANHKLTRQIVDMVAARGGVLCVEKLLGIRDRVKGTKKVNRMLHAWPFAQLLQLLVYKAARAGVRVVEVDPRHTSQRCNRCGHTAKSNRASQAEFACKKCKYRVHADLNAARNIAAKGACSLGTGSVTEPTRGEGPDSTIVPPDNRNPSS